MKNVISTLLQLEEIPVYISDCSISNCNEIPGYISDCSKTTQMKSWLFHCRMSSPGYVYHYSITPGCFSSQYVST